MSGTYFVKRVRPEVVVLFPFFTTTAYVVLLLVLVIFSSSPVTSYPINPAGRSSFTVTSSPAGSDVIAEPALPFALFRTVAVGSDTATAGPGRGQGSTMTAASWPYDSVLLRAFPAVLCIITVVYLFVCCVLFVACMERLSPWLNKILALSSAAHPQQHQQQHESLMVENRLQDDKPIDSLTNSRCDVAAVRPIENL